MSISKTVLLLLLLVGCSALDSDSNSLPRKQQLRPQTTPIITVPLPLS